jgi:hypothetical protein
MLILQRIQHSILRQSGRKAVRPYHDFVCKTIKEFNTIERLALPKEIKRHGACSNAHRDSNVGFDWRSGHHERHY